MKFSGPIISSVILVFQVWSQIAIGKTSNRLRPISRTELKIQEPMVLNGMSKKQIYDLRTRSVQNYQSFLVGDYVPSEEVFGQIEDNKNWWGFLGLLFYGPGKKSSEGASRDSVAILNPFALITVEEAHAVAFGEAAAPPQRDPPSWRLDSVRCEGNGCEISYGVSDFTTYLQTAAGKAKIAAGKKYDLHLDGKNARDFGLEYMSVDSSATRGVEEALSQLGRSAQLRHFIHTGVSCGQNGGCNNTSPSQPELEFRVKSFPAQLTLKLWQENPESLNSKPDFIVTIHLN